MKQLIVLLFLALPLFASAQLTYEIEIQFAQEQYEMTPKQAQKMTNELQQVYATYPNAFIYEIEARGWETLNLGGFFYPLSNARGNNVLQELNRFEATVPMTPTSGTIINAQQYNRSGSEYQKVIIKLDIF